MAYAYNTFEAWLQGQGLGSSLDGTGELKDGTSQAFFSSQYAAWLNDLLDYYAEAIRTAYGLAPDYQFAFAFNPNDPTGLPTISGLTAAQVDQLFGDTSDFSWTSGKVNLVTHTRYYSNSFDFSALNHAPTADPAEAGGAEDDTSIAITLTGSDADAGDTVESFTLTSLPPATAGVLYTDAALLNAAVTGLAYTATGEALTLYFVPAGNFNGEVQFSFTASDGEAASTAKTATITVSQLNDAAVFDGNTSGSGEEDGGPIVGTLTVSDDADGMTAPDFRIETGDGPSHGTASIDSSSGEWSYTPDADFNGTDHFTVSVTDDDGNTETQVIDIAVSPAVDPTVTRNDEFTADEDTGGSGNVLDNDSNPDNQQIVALSGVRDAASLPRIVITEIMANPALIADEADGEWFEVYNAGAAPVDLNGWTIQIGGNAIVVDSPTPISIGPGGFFVFAANLFFVNPLSGAYETGPLGLANDGTTISLFDPASHEIDRVAYLPDSDLAGPEATFPEDIEGRSFYLRDAGADNGDGLLWETTPLNFSYGVAGNLGTPGQANPIFAGATGLGDPPVVGQPAVFLSGALLTVNADGTFVFDSNHAYDFLAEGEPWIERFNYTLSGGQTANVVLTIEGVNDAPVAHDDVYGALEDAPLIVELPNAVSVLSNDRDPDSAALTASLVAPPSHGSFTFHSDGTFVYTPDPEFSGTDHFTYRVNDGFVYSNVATVEIQVVALNDAPVAHDDEAMTDAHGAISGDVLGNDTDVENDTLVVTALAALAPGDALPKIVISEIMDNPAGVPDATGEWFEVFNAGPVPVDLNGWTIQIGSNTIVVDNHEPLLILAGGYLTFAASADPDDNGGVFGISFGYVTGPLGLVDAGIAITLLDAEGHEVDRVDTHAIALPPEGHSFFLIDASLDNSLGTSWETSDGLAYKLPNFGTPGQGALIGSGPLGEIGQQVTLASGALLTLNADGTFDYDPNGAFDHLAEGTTATDGFAYTVSDGHGGVDTASVAITITGVAANGNGPMDSAILVSPASLTVSGGDTMPIFGQVFEAGLTESPGAASTIVAQLGYGATGSDPAGNPGWIWVDALFNTQSGNNDEYVATIDSASLTAGKYSYTYRFGVSVNGQAPLDWTYADLDGSGNGFAVDQLGVMTVDVSSTVNHAPVAVNDSADVNVDFEVEGFAPGVLANDSDPDGDDFDVVAFNGDSTHLGDLITLPSGARFAMFSDGAYDYIADAPLFFHLALGDSYVDTITYTIRDTHGSSSDGKLTITVHGVSPGPVAGDDTAATDEDTPLFVSALSGSVLANDVDFDGQGVLTVAAVNGSEAAVGHQITLASGALLTVFGGGGYFYDPNGQFDFLQSGATATDSFDYTAANSAGIWSTATVTITIGGLDEVPPPPADPHAPVAVDDFAQVFVDFEVEGFPPGVLANDADPDGNAIEVVAINGDDAHLGDLITLPSGAHFQMFSDGAYDYIADAPLFFELADGESVIDTISYTIRDTTGATDTATLSITVTAPIDSAGGIDLALLQFPSSLNLGVGQTSQVYGRVFEAGLTPQAGASAAIVAQFGYGAVGTDPQFDDSWVWENATFDSQITNDDLYVAFIPDDLAPGAYAYTYRFGLSSGGQIPEAWTYGDLDGSTNGLGIDQLGALLVV